MLLSGLSQRLQEILGKLRGRGRLSQADVQAAMREIKLALLEADVNYKVVKDFVAGLQEKCLGAEILTSLTPGQQVIKIVRDELTALLGAPLPPWPKQTAAAPVHAGGPAGRRQDDHSSQAGQTPASQRQKPLVVSLDTHRPAAREQLAIVAEAAELPATVPRGRNPLPWPGRLWTSLPNRIMTCYSWIPLAACIWMMR